MARRVVKYIKRRPWITITIAAVLPGACASLIEYVMTNGVSGGIPIIAAIAGGAVAAILLHLLRAHNSNDQLETVESGVVREVIREISVEDLDENARQSILPDSATEERVLSPRTPAELVDEIAGMTELVAECHSARHIGQWLRVEGPVEDVSRYYKEIRLTLGEAETSLFLTFDECRWSERLQSLNVGDRVVAIGKISRVRRAMSSGLGGYVSLEACELID